MKKKTVVILSVLLAVLIAIGIFAYAQRNNIAAFVDALRYSNEEVEEQLNAYKSDVETFLKEENDIDIRELTEEESKALSEGKLTEEEMIDILVGKTETPTPTPVATSTPKPSSNSPKPTPTPTPTPDEKETAKERVAELIAKLYVEKSKYLGKLDAIEAQVRSEYLSNNNPKTMTNDEIQSEKKKFLTEYLPMVASWEKECDSVVGGIISEIRENLKISGQDTAIADTLEAAYKNEKKSKKAYFINRYMD